MAFFNEFPHTRTYDSDLWWLIRRIQEVAQIVDNYVALNSIQFADPINWDITEQYPRLTIVLDRSGGAYISRQPVPAGVPLTNEDYWTEIYNTATVIDSIRDNVAHNNGDFDTATELIANGNLFWFEGNLYIAVGDIAAGNRFVEGSNCRKMTVDEKINLAAQTVQDALSQEALARETADAALGERITVEVQEEARSRDAADAALGERIAAEVQTRADADNSIIDMINALPRGMWINVNDHDIDGDGVTDITDKLQTLINSLTNGGTIYFPQGVYILGAIALPQRNISFVGDPNFGSILRFATDDITMFTDTSAFANGVVRSFMCLKIEGGGRQGTTVFSLSETEARHFDRIWFYNCVIGFNVDASRNLKITNILQTGDLANYIITTKISQNKYNWDVIVDGWQVETNWTPRPTDPWFTLTGLICSQFSNMITEGRMECIAFDIQGMNEGTFFTNCVLVCPTFGFRITRKDGVQPACVDIANVSIDQTFGGGIVADVWWLQITNFACVNGNQRNNTEAAIILLNGCKDVAITNALIYNMNYTGISIGTTERVSIANCSIKQGTIAGYAYSCPTQTGVNPRLINNFFESVEPVAGKTYAILNDYHNDV